MDMEEDRRRPCDCPLCGMAAFSEYPRSLLLCELHHCRVCGEFVVTEWGGFMIRTFPTYLLRALSQASQAHQREGKRLTIGWHGIREIMAPYIIEHPRGAAVKWRSVSRMPDWARRIYQETNGSNLEPSETDAARH